MRKRFNRGFTIVEIATVIFIIAILATITITMYNTVQMQARDTKRKNDITILQTALEKYYDKNGEYPFSCDAYASCASSNSSYQSSVGYPPIDYISGATTTLSMLQGILPGIDNSFGDPKEGTSNPINAVTPGSGYYISKNSYFLLSVDLFNVGTTVFLSTSDKAGGSYITCNFSAIQYNTSGKSNPNASHYYVVGYFSEGDNKWVFYEGKSSSTLSDTRWNYDNKPQCVPQSS